MATSRINMLLGAAALVAASVPAASAADVEAPVIEAAPSWSGFYAGAHLGYGHVKTDATDSPFTQGAFAGTGASWNSLGAPYDVIGASDSSFLGGVEVGYDFELPLGGFPLVVGAVADFSGINASAVGQSVLASDTFASFDTDWTATVRGRVGIAADDFLFFGSGGLAIADIDVRAFDLSAAPSAGMMDVTGGGLETGWVVGGGAEWRFRPNWSLSLEYLHYGFGNVTATGPAIVPAGAFPRFVNDVSFDTVRVGLKWRM